MKRATVLLVVLLILPLALLQPPVPVQAAQVEDRVAAGDDELVTGVRRSIEEGVSFLKNQQRADGGWEIGPGGNAGSGGWTALVLLALLNSGVSAKDAVVQKGLAYLRSFPPERTYVVGLQTMAYCLAKQPEDRERIQRNVDWLLAARLSDGWTYTKLRLDNPGTADNSNTQYALLGLHEAIQAGYVVNPKTLQSIQKLYLETQFNGSWSYRPTQRQPLMTMTTAGLCNLVITGMDLALGKSTLRADGSAENCGDYVDNEPIVKALDWIGDRFPARLTSANIYDRFGSPFYCLYGIERAGRLTGQRFFGGHDWYEVGCRYLVSSQKADGSWSGGAARGAFDHWPVIATSFSLLFLSKGRTPVLISKLAYGPRTSMGWNNKRSDMKHLVDFASRELFKGEPLAWQVFDARGLDAPTEAARRQLAAQLLQTPVIYFNGHGLAPRDKEAEILKECVNNGGFILAECCCGKDRHPNFDGDFRRLVKELFPDAELKPLEPDHPIWLASGKFAISPRDFPLEGVKQGCKTVVVYSPVPLAGYWESNLHADGGRGQKAFQLGANIIAYATGLEPPPPRLSRVEITGGGEREKVKRGYLQVAQLRHEGDWQPAPRAMRNLMSEARKAGLDVLLQTKPIYPADEGVLDYRLLYLHGRNTFTTKSADLKHLRFNLKSGGLLFADACCGSATFDKSFRGFIKELFGDDKLTLEPVPLNDELYSVELNGKEIQNIRRRVQAGDGKRVDPEMKTLRPALEGVKWRGRWIVLYSKYDIGCALEKHTSPDCLGHDADSALRLARAAVLYALRR